MDVVAAGEGRILAGAVRRLVVAEYEELFAACGTTAERVDLSPLAAIEARRREAAPSLDLFLGDTSFATRPPRGGRPALLPLPPARPSGATSIGSRGSSRASRPPKGAPWRRRFCVFGEGSPEVVTGLRGRGFQAASGPRRHPAGLGGLRATAMSADFSTRARDEADFRLARLLAFAGALVLAGSVAHAVRAVAAREAAQQERDRERREVEGQRARLRARERSRDGGSDPAAAGRAHRARRSAARHRGPGAAPARRGRA